MTASNPSAAIKACKAKQRLSSSLFGVIRPFISGRLPGILQLKFANSHLAEFKFLDLP
jgi:hypothetical protein